MPSAMKRQVPFPGRNEIAVRAGIPESNQAAKSSARKDTRNNHSTDTANVSRRTRRFKNGTKALREIKALQRSTKLLIPKSRFCKVVREIMNHLSYLNLRIQSSALEALQEAAEMYMVQFFEDSLLCCLHSKRVTLQAKDCHLMRRLRGPAEVGNL